MDKLELYLETQRLALVATEAIEAAMDAAGVRRSDIAANLEIPKSRVTRVLNGSENLTLKTLAHFGLAAGVRWEIVGYDAFDSSKLVTSIPGFIARTDRQPYLNPSPTDCGTVSPVSFPCHDEHGRPAKNCDLSLLAA